MREGTIVQHEPPPRWTPEAQAQLITLWEQGLDPADIAQRLDLTPTAVHRRARYLQRHGLLQPRLPRRCSANQQILAQVVTFLVRWAEEPDVNEVFVGQLRHLAMEVARHGRRWAVHQVCHRHERN